MRSERAVRDVVEGRGAAILCTEPTVATLTPAKCEGASMLSDGYREPAGSAQTTLESFNIAESSLHIDGFSIVVRVFRDGLSTKNPSAPIAAHTDIQSIVSSALERIVDRTREANWPTTNLSRPQPEPLLTAGERAAVPHATPTETVLRVGPLELNLLERTAKRGDRQIELLPREFRLLRYMMEHSDELLTRSKILQEVWNYKVLPQTNLVNVHISQLRRKVDGENEQSMIRTVRGAGFVLSANPLSFAGERDRSFKKARRLSECS